MSVKASLTLQQLFDHYFNDFVQHRCRSKDEIHKNFNRYFTDLKNSPIDEIKSVDLQRWHNALGAHRGHPIANRCLTLFSAIFNYGEKFELISYRRNPAKSIEKFPEESRTRVLSDDETHRLLAAIDQIGSGNRDVFKIAVLCAARIANCCSMAWSEIDFDRGVWTIPCNKFKSGRTTKIPLPEQALEILNKRKLIHGSSKWVFPSKSSKTGHVIYPYTSWRKICALANLQDLVPHDLRRTNATKQAELGASMAVIGANLGHANLQSTEIYTRPQLEARR